MPHSTDLEYGERAIPQYERAVAMLGGEPVRIPLDRKAAELRKIIDSCDAVLLPGSNADVDPARFHQDRSPHCAAADARREEVDWLLLDDAYANRKPVLGICYGLQSLNVYRRGSLVQHIPEFLPEAARTKVNHEAGRKVAVAHTVEIASDSLLASVLCRGSRARLSGGAQLRSNRRSKDDHGRGEQNREGHSFRFEPALSERSEMKGADKGAQPDAPSGAGGQLLPVNSSHHQSADTPGAGLRIVARCPDDGIIEALEGTDSLHFVLSVQWHPERSVDEDEVSRAIFRALIEAAQIKR